MPAPQQVHVIHINRSYKVQKRNSDKKDRHTIDQVLDYRTRKFIFDLTESRRLTSLESLVNSGKEANVYLSHAPSFGHMAVAVKIYSTSKMSFRNRQIYIEGDRRFSNLQASNSRKLIKLWGEKEFRNQKRIFDSGLIYAPTPILVHENIFVQELIGQKEQSAPRLVDVAKYLSTSRLIKIYYSVLRMMRDLYYKCRLVHGDLSEYNLLFYSKKIYVIDVGQATDIESPIALTLLRIDIRNINCFFAKMLIPTVDMPHCLAFILSSGVPPDVCQAAPGSHVVDCCGPLRVDASIVQWLRQLHSCAKFVDYYQIKQDDGFLKTRICNSLKETGEFVEDKNRLESLGVEIIDGEVYEERFETEEEQQDCEDEQNVVQIGDLRVNMDTLSRDDYSKQQWKQIYEYLRSSKHQKMVGKKPKSQKRREKLKAMRKRRGF